MRFPVAEIVLALFFAGVVIAFASESRWASLPFLTLFVTGYGYVALLAIAERISHLSPGN